MLRLGFIVICSLFQRVGADSKVVNYIDNAIIGEIFIKHLGYWAKNIGTSKAVCNAHDRSLMLLNRSKISFTRNRSSTLFPSLFSSTSLSALMQFNL